MSEKFTNLEGISYRVDNMGEFVYETEIDREIAEGRDRWCVCTDQGQIIGLSETAKGKVSAEEVLLSHMDDPDKTLHCYKINFVEFFEALERVRRYGKENVPGILDKDGRFLRYPHEPPRAIDKKMLSGERYREAEIRRRQVKKRVNGKWTNLFDVNDFLVE